VTRDFLVRNANNIVQVNVVNEDLLKLIAYYSPELDCLFKGAAALLPRIKSTKATKHTAGVLVEFHGPKPAYQYPIDTPQYNDTRGPNCYGLPNPPLQLPTIQFKDGTEDDPRFASRDGSTAPQPLTLPSILQTQGAPSGSSGAPSGGSSNPLGGLLSPSDAAKASPSMGDAGSKSEQAWMDQLLGPILGRPAAKVPSIAGLLWGPMARGSQVEIG